MKSAQILIIYFAFLLFEMVHCHRRNGHGPGGHGPPMEFLADLDEEARDEFFSIVKNKKKTKGEVKAKMEEWATENNVETEYQKYAQKEKQIAAQIHEMAVGNLSGQALELFNKIWQINQDDGLTFLQDCQQIAEAFSNADPMVRRIVASSMPPKPLPGPPPRDCPPFPGFGFGHGHHGPGGGHGCRGGGRFGGGKGKGRKSSSSSGSSSAEQREKGQQNEQNVGENIGNGRGEERISTSQF